MASSFAFDFTGDDIEEDARAGDEADPPDLAAPEQLEQGRTPQRSRVPVSSLDLSELLASLPSSIAYSTTCVSSPRHGRRLLISRRALFDVRMQIMAETCETTLSSDQPTYACQTGAADSMVHEQPNTQSSRSTSARSELGLRDSDIEKDVYEGGFKSWEGAMDLARFLGDWSSTADQDGTAYPDSIVELGCGTALPSLVLLLHAIANNLAIRFTFADYNDSVLRLVTVPNILLVWAAHNAPAAFSPRPPALASSDYSAPGEPRVADGDGDLTITPDLVQTFTADMRARGISIALVAGPWCPALVECIAPSAKENTLVLAAETIYSPSSTNAFTQSLVAILRQSSPGRAFVAAKRVYFGVGGGVESFKKLVAELGGRATEVQESGIPECDPSLASAGGVGRCLIEVQP